jgi:hypothetical protein
MYSTLQNLLLTVEWYLCFLKIQIFHCRSVRDSPRGISSVMMREAKYTVTHTMAVPMCPLCSVLVQLVDDQ